MPEPKISRRCPTCGTSIRDQAFFCPECGNKLDPPQSHQKQSLTIHDTQEEVFDAGQTMTEKDFRSHQVPEQTMTETDFRALHQPEPTMTEADFRSQQDPGKTMTEADFRALRPQASGPGKAEQGKPRRRELGAPGSKIQRVTNKARDVEDDVKHRVQKFRDISSVVIEEASYDPSLRFVLVVMGLVILFVVIVLLNKFIG